MIEVQTKKTLAEIETNNNFMQLYEAEKLGKQYDWYKWYRKEYRKLTTRKNKKN